MYSTFFVNDSFTQPRLVFHSRDIAACVRFANRRYTYLLRHSRRTSVFPYCFVCNDSGHVLFIGSSAITFPTLKELLGV